MLNIYGCIEIRLPYQRHSSLSSSPVIAGQSQSALLSRILSCVASTLPRYNIELKYHPNTPTIELKTFVKNCSSTIVRTWVHTNRSVPLFPSTNILTSYFNCYQSANIVGQLQSQSKGTTSTHLRIRSIPFLHCPVILLLDFLYTLYSFISVHYIIQFIFLDIFVAHILFRLIRRTRRFYTFVKRNTLKAVLKIYLKKIKLSKFSVLCRCKICYFMQNVKGISQKLQPPWLKNLMIQSRISEIP